MTITITNVKIYTLWSFLALAWACNGGFGAIVLDPDEIVVSWDTDGLTDYGPSPWESPLELTHGVRVESGLTRGFGLDTGGTPPANVWGARGFSSPDPESAVDAGQYISFTVAPEAGQMLHITGIDQTFRRSSTGPTGFQWQYRVGDDGSFSDAGSAWTYTGTETNGSAQSTLDLTGIVDLSEISEPVTFRLIGWGGGSVGSWGLGRQSGADLVIYGTAIPEPEAIAVWLGGLALLITCFRKYSGKVPSIFVRRK